jgi:hypothetical protein
MPISNMQQARQMYEYGGLSAPRQNYGLGSFVKKAVRGVKKIAKSPLGKAALLGGGAYMLGGAKFLGGEGMFAGGQGMGRFGNLMNLIRPAATNTTGKRGLLAGALYDKDGVFSGGRAAMTGLGLASMAPLLMGGGGDDDVEDVVQLDPNAAVQSAKNYYSGLGNAGAGLNFMPQKKYVNQNFYAADGGRAGYAMGDLVRGSAGVFQPTSASMSAGDAPSFEGGSGMGGMIADLIRKNPQMFSSSQNTSPVNQGDQGFVNQGDQGFVNQGSNGMFSNFFSNPNIYNQFIKNKKDFIDQNLNLIDDREEVADGGRAGYAMGGDIDEEEEFIRSGAGQRIRPQQAFLAMGGGAGEAQAEQMLQAEFIKYKNRGGELSFQEFVQAVMQQQQQAQGMQQPTMAANGGRMGYAEGGIMDTEAAEMIDMGGQEKDYRDEGGFVAMGGEERADDVPARLSKNEFVFTADAVRQAGGGDIDRGSEVMQNMMDNLEQGGQISQGSQGLGGEEEVMEEPDGAQAMYEQQQALQSRMA